MFAFAASFLAMLTTVSVTVAFFAFRSWTQSDQTCSFTSGGQATIVAFFFSIGFWLLVIGLWLLVRVLVGLSLGLSSKPSGFFPLEPAPFLGGRPPSFPFSRFFCALLWYVISFSSHIL